MPELPEVETVARTLAARVVGRAVVAVRVARADVIDPAGFDLAAALVGRVVAGVARRAKRVVVTLDDGRAFYVHLGMTGRLTCCAPGDEVAKHTHVALALDDGTEIRFCDARRFGGVFWLGDAPADARLGPEPLQLRAAALHARLTRTRRAVKVALLDQALVAGLGNIYVDEALFAAGVHPLRPGRDLARGEVARINAAVKRTLRKAIAHGGSTLRDYVDAAGARGGFQNLHRVYGRGGAPCGRCGTAVVKITLGGRGTHFCPTCQPA